MIVDEARKYGWGERAEAFAAWRNKVDEQLNKLCGMVGDDLPDWDYASGFDAGMSPAQAARAVFSAAGFF